MVRASPSSRPEGGGRRTRRRAAIGGGAAFWSLLVAGGACSEGPTDSGTEVDCPEGEGTGGEPVEGSMRQLQVEYYPDEPILPGFNANITSASEWTGWIDARLEIETELTEQTIRLADLARGWWLSRGDESLDQSVEFVAGALAVDPDPHWDGSVDGIEPCGTARLSGARLKFEGWQPPDLVVDSVEATLDDLG